MKSKFSLFPRMITRPYARFRSCRSVCHCLTLHR
nr:MAG TPA: hypothetical protein [Caudoviricetes sp.]